MGRKATVEKLPDEQFDFVITAILNGLTDREISSSFRKTFDTDLPKSSLNTWRNKAGNELAERYRLRRFQVRSVVEELKTDGIDVEDDHYKRVIENLEDHLLTAERDLLAQNPVKLLFARQEHEHIQLKRAQLDLNREKLEFEKSKYERDAAVRTDRLAIALDVCKYMLYWCNENEPHLAEGLTRRWADILTGIEGHLDEQAQAA